MAQIPLLYPGCTGQEILDTINALIAAVNGGAGQTISYNDLTDKPTINGVEVIGALTTLGLKVKISETQDFDRYNETWATKDYVDAMETEAVAAAQAAAREALAGKLDKDLSNLEAVDAFSGDSYLPIVTPSGVYKVKIVNVAAYTETQSLATQNAANTAIASERKTLAITGEQDGHNIVFGVTGGYKTGTSTLYLNGQLMAEGRDYEETDTQTFTMLTYIPEEEDVLLFRAIPLGTSRI